MDIRFKEGILLVLGNGFDLSLEVKSRYSDYFESNYFEKKRAIVEKLVVDSKSRIPGIFSPEQMDKINCWDIFFYLYYRMINKPNGNWCDLEGWIKESFRSRDLSRYDFAVQDFKWDAAILFSSSNTVKGKESKYASANDIYKAISAYFSYCNIIDGRGIETGNPAYFQKYYQFLLSELNDFEKCFGEYISTLTNNPNYLDSARERIELLTNGERIWQIDTFNYSLCSEKIKVRFIDGDINNPIFGINILKDEKEWENAYKFTKTARRIEQDSFGVTKGNESEIDFNHVIVFGLSLNEQDYDYFCYLFTRLNFSTMDVEKMGTIEFVFNVYDENKSDQIRRNYSESVYALINFYEDLINPGRQSILLNLLRFSSKLIIREADFNKPLPKGRPVVEIINLA